MICIFLNFESNIKYTGDEIISMPSSFIDTIFVQFDEVVTDSNDCAPLWSHEADRVYFSLRYIDDILILSDSFFGD